MAHGPALVIALPFLGAFVCGWMGSRRIGFARWGAVGTAAIHAFIALSLLSRVTRNGPLTYATGGWPAPLGIEVRVDILGAVVLTLLGCGATLILLFAQSHEPAELGRQAERWYWPLCLTLLGGMSGLVIAKDLFNLFVMAEICSIAACGIISVDSRPAALEASFKYLLLSAVGSGAVLLATAMLYSVTGYLDMDAISRALPAAAASFPRVTMGALALYLVGFGLKAALFPLHVWLPDAHSAAPSASSALLSGLVVKVYVVALARIGYQVWGPDLLWRSPAPYVMFWFSAGAMFFGSIVAIAQRDIKRLLAYSTIAQMGYIFFGLSLRSENAVAGALLHVFNHAVMKVCLFLAAGAMIARTGKRDLAGLSGIARSMPLTTAAFTIGALAMIGVPGTNGFISKWYVALGALDLGRPLYAVLVVASSLLSGAYYLPFVISAYFGPDPGHPRGREGPPAELAPIVILAAVCVLTGFLPRFPLQHMLEVAKSFFALR
ncbi:MAG: proton-conducting transporter membrane subunit [Bacillota bacterium]|nr:proton-conducting transporter membrane subunit [Bacillota bacterium]